MANHPYVAVSGEAGEFIIDRVPVGRYPIRMWHEGVLLTRVIPRLQQFEYEPPYEALQEIAVEADKETVVNFELKLRNVLPLSTPAN